MPGLHVHAGVVVDNSEGTSASEQAAARSRGTRAAAGDREQARGGGRRFSGDYAAGGLAQLCKINLATLAVVSHPEMTQKGAPN